MQRLSHLDRLRGLVIVLMALDHVRFFYGQPIFNPLDISQTNAFWFFTRWITHFCAPVFVFLAGVGIALSPRQGKEQSIFLLQRGLWLIAIEFLWINQIWKEHNMIVFQVFWVLGASMLLMAALLHLPRLAVGICSGLTIASHNLLGKYDGPWWNLLHQPGPFFGPFYVLYPLLPWMAVMALGWAVGPRLALYKGRDFLRVGGILTSTFIAVRLSNFYGDPIPWQWEETTSATLLSFLNCEKYPPSFLYLLMTLGPACMLLAPLQQINGIFASALNLLGRNPLFFYVIHVPIVTFAAWLRGFEGPASGAMVYLMWSLVLALCFILCKQFDRYKQRHKGEKLWLSYL